MRCASYLYINHSHAKSLPNQKSQLLLKMATTNLIATSNAVRFFSSSCSLGNPDHFLSRRLSQTTHRDRVQTSCCYLKMSLEAVKPVVKTETTRGIGIVRFLRGKSYFVTGATGFLGKGYKTKNLRP